MKEFSVWLNESYGLNLYHYSSADSDTLVVDPKYFAQNYFTKKDYNLSDVPRSFWYTSPKDKESFFESSNLYTVKVSPDKIYDLRKDPDGILAKHSLNATYDFQGLFQELKEKYLGAKYRTDRDIVVTFHPLVAQKVEKTPELM